MDDCLFFFLFLPVVCVPSKAPSTQSFSPDNQFKTQQWGVALKRWFVQTATATTEDTEVMSSVTSLAFGGVLMTWGGIYLCWLLEVKMKTNWKIKWFCFFSTVFLSLLRGGWDVTKHKYFVTVPKYIFQVSVLYLRINFDFLKTFWLSPPFIFNTDSLH